VANNSTGWCAFASDLSREWDLCSDFFEEMNVGDQACIMTINECRDLTTASVFAPMAGQCLSTCDGNGTCTSTIVGTLLEDPAMCGENLVSPFTRFSTVDMPWGIVASFMYALVSFLLAVGGGGSQPSVVDCLGANIQAFLLFRAMWLVMTLMGDAASEGNTTCAFLLFSTGSLYTSVTVSVLTIMVAISTTIPAGGSTVTPLHKVCRVICVVPWLAAAAYFVIGFVSSLPIFIASLPGLVALLPILLMQLLLILCIVACLACCIQLNPCLDGAGGPDSDGGGDIINRFLAIIGVLFFQGCQSMSLLAFYLYITGSYGKCYELFFSGFALPPFTFPSTNFDLALAWDLAPILDFELSGLELLNTALAVQLVTFLGVLAERIIVRFLGRYCGVGCGSAEEVQSSASTNESRCV
jgi:hypothetical protein